MSEARNDTAEARLQADAAAGAAEGRHRGPAMPDEHETPAHGRHRREGYQMPRSRD
ncbi:hypothetical protein [Actinacidiphila oryziradicis]|uniref:hypothetical protein n=1 Tax=Actinacidiphila oryziradicis TaxID=2571141 RepID=UPI00145EF455|nr:hypothetical protein [Actinacidiphila oryziradicis]